MLRKW